MVLLKINQNRVTKSECIYVPIDMYTNLANAMRRITASGRTIHYLHSKVYCVFTDLLHKNTQYNYSNFVKILPHFYMLFDCV